MTTATSLPHHGLRDDVDALLDRLARLEAHRVSVRGVADGSGDALASSTLVDVLDDLERDLMLAARATDRLQSRVAGESAVVPRTR